MSPDDYIRHLEQSVTTAAKHSLQKTLQHAERLIRANLPANRRKTRRAVRSFVRRTRKGFRGHIALKFRQEFPANNTKTQRYFYRVWRRSKPVVITTFRTHLSRHLKGL